MELDRDHLEYLGEHRLGRLATVAPVEVRGRAEQVTAESPGHAGLPVPLIRIHPRRVVSWNVGPGEPSFRAQTLGS